MKKLTILARSLLLLPLMTEGFSFKKTNINFVQPVTPGQTAKFNCKTDKPAEFVELLKKNEFSDKILKPDDQQLVLLDQEFTLLVSNKNDAGEYICRAHTADDTIEKSFSLFVYDAETDVVQKPEIKNKEYQVDEGSTLSITCLTKGSYSKLTWTKQSQNVKNEYVSYPMPYFSNGEFIVESVLEITNIQPEDDGVYTCISTSRFDTTKKTTTNTTVTVRPRILAWKVDRPELHNAMTATEGASAIISCLLTYPDKEIKFFRKGSPPREIEMSDSKYRLINNQELIIYKVSYLDHGDYICRTDDNSLPEKKIKLFFNIDGARKPYASVTPKYLPLDFDASSNVTCKSYGNNAEMTWLRYKNLPGNKRTLIVLPDSRTKIDGGKTPQGKYEKRAILLFENADTDDQGSYVCKVRIGDSAVFSDVEVSVKTPSSPEIRRFGDLTITEGRRMSLACRAKGSPRPTITYLKDGRPIDGSKWTLTSKSLAVDKALFPRHNGVYSCVAENMFGKASRDSKVTVTVAPQIDKSQGYAFVTHGQPLEVKCNVLRSNPEPTVTWLYQPGACLVNQTNCDPVSSAWQQAEDSLVKTQAKNFSVESVFQIPSSDVKKFFIKCLARHDYGKDSYQFIGIIDKRDVSEFLKTSPKNVNEDEGSMFNLTCEGQAGLFRELYWTKDAQNLTAGDNIALRSVGSAFNKKLLSLIVKQMTLSHEGTYTCHGVTTGNKQNVVASSVVKVKEIYKPSVLSITSSQTDQIVRVSCSVDSHPQAAVTWFKNGERLSQIGKLVSLKDCTHSGVGKYFDLEQTHKRRNYTLVICNSYWRSNNGSFACRAENKLGVAESVLHDVIILGAPEFISEQTDDYLDTKFYSARCEAEGNPVPLVWWEKGTQTGFKAVTRNSTLVSYLNFSESTEVSYGLYRCVASNLKGTVYDEMTLSRPLAYTGTDKRLRIYHIVGAVVGVVLLLLVVTIFIILCKRRRLYGGFYMLSTPPAPDYFQRIDPARSICDQIHKLPYFPEWEFPRSRVKMKTCIGSGAFGEVYTADAMGINDFDPRYKISMKHKAFITRLSFSRKPSTVSGRSQPRKKAVDVVAVKILKDGATQVEYKDLISEMKILIHIGRHQNIVNLLGTCTKGVEKDTMLLLEFCPHGSLLSFMKERRQTFKPIWSKQHQGMENEFTTFDLCVASYQIAKGLEFLASRKCVHRDVAARNVLVGAGYVMKVADFGLARDVYHDEQYVKVSGGLLPIKWMPVESIFDRVFTHMSDVWSYGVLLWEVMTLGGSPYPNLPTKDLPEFLNLGHRMTQPQFCPNEIYDLMNTCWLANAPERPTFTQIVKRVADVIEVHCNPAEINLYLDKADVDKGAYHGEGVTTEDDYLRPVDTPSPPPTYLQSMNHKCVDLPPEDNDLNQKQGEFGCRRPSERYVSEHRLEAPHPPLPPPFTPSSSDTNCPYEQAIDSIKLNESLNDSMPDDMEMTPLYNNVEPKKKRIDDTTNDYKNVSEEKQALLQRTPSPVQELRNFIDKQYENLGNLDNTIDF